MGNNGYYKTTTTKTQVSVFVVVRYRPILPVFGIITSLALWQSYDFPRVSEATIEDMDKRPDNLNKKAIRNNVYILWDALLIHG